MRKIVTRSFLIGFVALVLAACSGGGGAPVDEHNNPEPETFEINMGIRAGSDTEQGFLSLDGEEIDEYKVTVTGNVNDFDMDAETMSTQSTSVSIDQLRAIVNGSVFVLSYDADGDFEAELPVDSGSNTIQLQILSEAGDYYTTNVVSVIVTLERLDFRVVLTWDKGDSTDIDLHMFKAPASSRINADYLTWENNGFPHVGWYEKIPGTFGPTPERNPFLDIDNTEGYGPETIVFQEASAGTYHIWVHTYFLREDTGGTNATVRIYLNGEVYEFKKRLVTDWSTWEVATITIPSNQVTSIDALY